MGKYQQAVYQTAIAVGGLNDSDVMTCLSRLCKGFDTPLSKELSILIKAGNYRTVLTRKVDPNNYTDPHVYFADRALACFVSKYPFKTVTTALERRDEALKSVLEAEAQCALTNRRFLTHQYDDKTAAIIRIARRKISKILGPLNLESLFQEVRFGPGITLSMRESHKTAFYFKLGCDVTATHSLRPFADSVFQHFPAWARILNFRLSQDDYGQLLVKGHYEFVSHNRITTVPKTALKDRPIAIEPHLNQFLQLGVGGMIRRRLLRSGIDLQHGQKAHRNLARLGSLDPSLLATIDLSSASDTIAYRVVEELLPPDWFHLMNLLRCSRGRLPSGEEIVYEKFSSMGNGFTFELETLIFYSIVLAVHELHGFPLNDSITKVYGDDIITSTESSVEVMNALRAFGFKINEEKSFYTDVPFRESCGADYFSGIPVRPLYITSEIKDVTSIIDLANRIRVQHDKGLGTNYYGCRGRFAWLYLLDRIPGHLRDDLMSPPGFPGGLWTPEVSRWIERCSYNSDFQRFEYRGIQLLRESVRLKMQGLAGIIHSAEYGSTAGRIPFRDVTRLKVRTGTVAVP